ncbi:MAG: hypothetical protein OHK0013_01960 [Sandaracinaceae bacterium]
MLGSEPATAPCYSIGPEGPEVTDAFGSWLSAPGREARLLGMMPSSTPHTASLSILSAPAPRLREPIVVPFEDPLRMKLSAEGEAALFEWAFKLPRTKRAEDNPNILYRHEALKVWDRRCQPSLGSRRAAADCRGTSAHT